jgi:hypothetical protein
VQRHPELASFGKSDKGRGRLLPVVGVVSAGIGTMAAVTAVPGDPQPAGALLVPALLLSAGLLTVPIIRANRNLAILLRAEHFLMVGLIYWLLLDPLQGAYPMMGASYEEVVLAFTAIGLMGTGIWIGSVGQGWGLPTIVLHTARMQLSSNGPFKAAIFAFLVGMFNFAFTSGFDPVEMINGLSACRFCAPWNRGAVGGSEAFVEHLKYFGYTLPSLAVLIWYYNGRLHPKTVCSVSMSLIMVAFLSQDGGRRVIGVVAGAALITWLLLQQNLKPRMLIVSVCAIGCLLVTMELMLKYRGVGFSADWQADDSKTQAALIHVDDNILRLTQLIKFIPDVQAYVGIEPLTFAMVRPVPRYFWPDKPVDPGYDLTALLGEEGFSLTTSVVGEFYAMHGLAGVFVGGFFFGRIANMWSKILSTPGGAGKAMTYGLGIMVLFTALRSLQDLVIMSYGLLAWLVIANVFIRNRSENRMAKVS